MAEFWPENQAEPSSAKIQKSPGGTADEPASSESNGQDPPTVLSSFRASSAIPQEPASFMASELAGEMLAHFRLDDYIGVGGMGAVFRATDIRLDRPVALKILPPDQAKDAEIVARFQHEARAAARLDHENIARVFFVGEDRSLHFIAFEFVEGINVRELIQQVGPLPPHEAVNYALQITGALMHAGVRSVVHRDIKPSNIIITPSGRAKLVDMGLARNFERRPDGGLTQSGVTLGTFDYISPEQARDPRSADARSDIYSLGCTLFHMLTGRPPFPEGTVLQKLLRHQEDSPPDPRHTNPLVPANLAEIVMRMMAKDPARRYQSPHELLSELLDVASDMGLRSSSPEGLIWVAEPSRPSVTRATLAIWAAAAAALVIAVLALNGWPGGQQFDAKRPPLNSNGTANSSAAKPNGDSDVVAVRGNSAGPPLANANTAKKDDNNERETQVKRSAPIAVSAPNELETASTGSEVISVGPHDDLRDALERAPAGAVIELSGEHRPQLRHRVDDTAGIRIEGKRLTVRAAPGTRPRIILNFDDQSVKVNDWNMFSLVGSQLEFDGIHFEITADSDAPPAMTMLALESSQATLRRCSFFQVIRPTEAARFGDSAVWVAQLDSGLGVNGQAPRSKITAHECIFSGGDGAFFLNGTARLDLMDCTLLPYRAPVRVRSAGFTQSVAAELRLTNVSWFGGGGPIFDLEFARVAVHCRESVFSHAAALPGVLARVDADSRLDWKGRRNLYHGLKHFFVTRIGNDLVPVAPRLRDWKESQDVEDRESVETGQSPWIITLAEAAGKNVTEAADAFRLAREDRDADWQPVGARYVLGWGPLYAVAADDVPPIGVRPSSVAVNQPNATTARPAEPSGEKPTTGTGESSAARLDMKKIMDKMPTGDASNSATAATTASAENTATPRTDALVVDPNPQSGSPFRSVAAACARADDGAVIEIRYNGELREPPIELGDRHLTIRAAAGFRPIINLLANPLELRGREPRLFDIRRGSLTLRDLDFRIAADPAVSGERWCLVAARGADVTIERCTASFESPAGLATTLLRIMAAEADEPMTAPMIDVNPARPQIQLRNSFAVGCTSLVRLHSAMRARIEIENCAVDVAENLLSLTGGMERSLPGALNELEIRHATIRSERELVSCEAGEPRGSLPRLEIDAIDSVFVGNGSSPWLRFKSPRPASELLGLLRWKGMNNDYDGVDVFWKIDSTLSGESEVYDWEKWSRFPDRSEIKEERGPVQFARSRGDTAPAQRARDHFKLNPVGSRMASDGGTRGADLDRIPAPPSERDDSHEAPPQ